MALVHYPQANVACLDGPAWVDFIRQKGESSLMSDEIAEALQYGRFQTKCDFDVDSMQDFGKQWIASLYKGGKTSAAQSADNGSAASQGLSDA